MLVPMSLSTEDVRHMALLARIGLDEGEVERLSEQLSSILDHFTALSAVDTEGVEPTAHPLPLANVMRGDSVSPSLPRADALANAPEEEEGYIRVRAVLE